MRLGKPIILTTTTLGIAIGLYEGYRFAGGLVVLMMALMGVIAVAMGTVVATVRRERREEEEAARRQKQANAAEGEPK
jgi:hypothetical protein